MATTKVSALAETTTPQSNDELLINQSGVSKKVKITNLPAGTPGTGSISTAMLADDAVTTDKLANSINSAITANTAKTSNVTHTGDVTGATALTIASGAVETGMIADDAVTAAKLANSINAEITANTAKTTNATHTGDVTGATTLTIAAGAVDIAMLSATGTAGSGNFLRGDNSWSAVDGLPSQSSNNGKFLTTNGSAASWAVLNTDSNSTTKGLYEMANVISANYVIGNNNNAMSAGPITINSNISVTVPSGSTWVIA